MVALLQKPARSIAEPEEEEDVKAARQTVAEFTYIDFTQNNVYYAANDYQGIEHVPGVPKISLNDVWVKCKVSKNKQKTF